MATAQEKLFSFNSYLADKGHTWSMDQSFERDGEEFLVTVTIYAQHLGAPSETYFQGVARGKPYNPYEQYSSVDALALHLLMLAFGEDPTT